MSDWCDEHKRYSAKRKPDSLCGRCWQLWFFRNPEDRPGQQDTYSQQGGQQMKAALSVIGLLFLVGCSTGLQERAFKDESGAYIVSRSLVNDRVTANQPHPAGTFACDSKMSAEAMAQWRQLNPGDERSAYSQCMPIEKYCPGCYQTTSDQPIGTIYKGPVEAAIIGGSIGAGLAMSGDAVTQQGGGGTANAEARVKLGKRRGR